MKFKDFPYERIHFDAAADQLKQLMAEFQKADTAAAQFAVHEQYYKLISHVRSMALLAEIRHSIDTSDQFYEAEKAFYDENLPAFEHLEVQYRGLLLLSPFRKELEQKIGGPAFCNIELAQKATGEAAIPLMQEENALVTAYEKLLAGAKIDWEGKILNLAMMEPYLSNANRDVRRLAAEKVNAYFESIAEELDSLYDKLVKNRTAQAKALGFETYTDLGYCRMQRNSYGRKEVEAFRSQIKKDFVPLAEKVWEKRRKRLGLSALYHMDEKVSFPQGSPAPTGTPEEILEAGRKMYRELSPETGKFMDFMLDGDLLDVLARPHKQVGGYMEWLPEWKAPFIFANFNGTSGDVDVITHECGHAFQGWLSGSDPVMEHSDLTMETAETHSMSMEFFTNPWMNAFFGARADDFITAQLEDAIVFVPYGCMVDEFQHIVYDNPDLTPKERKEAWQQLEKTYKPHMKYEDVSSFYAGGGYWQRQHHIYSLPFYYIDYVIAQTDAFQYKAWMQKDYQAAWKSYLGFCRASASDFFVPMLKKAGLASPFEAGTLSQIAKEIGALCGVTEA